MGEKKRDVEYRYYELPENNVVLILNGSKWNKAYGEGKDKLHFHNYYEIGICHEGNGKMIIGEKEHSFHDGCISFIPPSELHTTNTFGKKARWEWMYFDIGTIT